MGYNATFVFSSIVFAVLLILSYFISIETTYTKQRPDLIQDKKAARKIMRVSWMNQQDGRLLEGPVTYRQSKDPAKLPTVSENEIRMSFPKEPMLPPKEPYSQQLLVFRGRISNGGYLKEMLKPFPLMVFPSVAYAAIVNGIATGVLIGWIVTQPLPVAIGLQRSLVLGLCGCSPLYHRPPRQAWFPVHRCYLGGPVNP
jgi:hypothetical protein